MTGVPHNNHGGLTLVPLAGFDEVAPRVKVLIEDRSRRDDNDWTPVDIATPEFETYSNGEPDVRLTSHHVRGHDCVVLTTGPGTNEMIMRLLWALNYLAARRASRIMVVTGYFPLGRSDKDESDLRLTTPPMLVKIMKAAAMHPNGEKCLLDRIVCADPHSPQVTMSGGSGFITPIILSRRLVDPIVDEALAENGRICIAYPDDSAAKRFEAAIARAERRLDITIPSVSGIKRRDRATGKSKLIAMQGDLGELEGATAIMLDDEIATGGSVIDMGDLLRNKYHTSAVWADVTHGVLAGQASQIFMAAASPIDRINIMDTIPVHNRPELAPLIESGILRVHSWEEDLAWVIFHHHWNRSIREER